LTGVVEPEYCHRRKGGGRGSGGGGEGWMGKGTGGKGIGRMEYSREIVVC
jgi:hypothetical protein